MNKKAQKTLLKRINEHGLNAKITAVTLKGNGHYLITFIVNKEEITIMNLPATPNDKTWTFTGNKIRQAITRCLTNDLKTAII